MCMSTACRLYHAAPAVARKMSSTVTQTGWRVEKYCLITIVGVADFLRLGSRGRGHALPATARALPGRVNDIVCVSTSTCARVRQYTSSIRMCANSPFRPML